MLSSRDQPSTVTPVERLCQEGEWLLAHGGSQQALLNWDIRTNGLHRGLTDAAL